MNVFPEPFVRSRCARRLQHEISSKIGRTEKRGLRGEEGRAVSRTRCFETGWSVRLSTYLLWMDIGRSRLQSARARASAEVQRLSRLQEPPPAGRASPVERGGAGSRGSGRFLHGLLLLGGMARAARASTHGARGRSPNPPRTPPRRRATPRSPGSSQKAWPPQKGTAAAARGNWASVKEKRPCL